MESVELLEELFDILYLFYNYYLNNKIGTIVCVGCEELKDQFNINEVNICNCGSSVFKMLEEENIDYRSVMIILNNRILLA